MLQGGISGEGPYWGFQLGVNQTEGANDLPATCHQDACFNVADHDMPFCKPYVEASGGMFCARQFNATLMGMTGAAYVTRLDQHVARPSSPQLSTDPEQNHFSTSREKSK